MAALDMFKPLPLGILRQSPGQTDARQIAPRSVFQIRAKRAPGMKEFWGGKILEVTHLVPAWRPPGLMIVFLRFGNRLSALFSSVDDCMKPGGSGRHGTRRAPGVAGRSRLE